MIQLKSVYKTYNAMSRPVINDVHLTIRPQEFCVVIGANGCGKSTLFKLINQEIKPDSGEVNILGDVYSVKQQVKDGAIGDMTVFENLALALMKRPRPLQYQRRRLTIMHLLENLDTNLVQYLDFPLRTLSGGQQQVIATLMGLYSGNSIVLLDEHTAALDPRMQRYLMQLTNKVIKRLNLTALMITHQVEDALRYGDRLLMINEGRVVLDIRGLQKKALTQKDVVGLYQLHTKTRRGEYEL